MNTYLLIEAIPYEGESAASFLLRTAQLNAYSSIYQLLGKEIIQDITRLAPNCDLTDLPRFKLALWSLNINVDYKKLALERVGPTSRSPRKWGELTVDENLLNLKKFSYCPKCLADEPFFRKIWLFKPIYACPIHSIFLINECSQCAHPIELQKGIITQCPNCNFTYSLAPVKRCSTMSTVKWFMNILEEGDSNFFHEFTSYWLALEKFAQLDKTLTAEKHLKITYEYFTNQSLSIKRLSTWINKRILLAHPRIQLIPFLKDRNKFYYYLNYIKLIEKDCEPYILNNKSIKLSLSRSEAMLALGIGRQRFRSLAKDDFLKLGKGNDHYDYLSSTDIEKYLTRQSADLFKPKAKPNFMINDDSQLSISKIAENLHINYETARKLVKSTFFNDSERKEYGKTISISKTALEKFDNHYIAASALAKQLEVNPTNIVEKLLSINISPISGPHIDGQAINIFSRVSIANIKQHDIIEIKNYPTKTGRSKARIQVATQCNYYSLAEAANLLRISQQQASFLSQIGILTRNQIQPISIRIEKSSVEALKNKIENDDYISIEQASDLLNCNLNWLIQYWCKSGFLEIEDLIYWRLVKKTELDQIIKLKEEYMTGAEANTLLGMPHSHITNLQNQGLIKAYYMGTTDAKIRLFKLTDVLQLKMRGLPLGSDKF